jgi:hypothetical protein
LTLASGPGPGRADVMQLVDEVVDPVERHAAAADVADHDVACLEGQLALNDRRAQDEGSRSAYRVRGKGIDRAPRIHQPVTWPTLGLPD